MRAKAGLWLRRALGVGLLLGAWQLASLHFPPLVVPPIPRGGGHPCPPVSGAGFLAHRGHHAPAASGRPRHRHRGLAGSWVWFSGLCPKLEDVGTPMIHVLQSVPPGVLGGAGPGVVWLQRPALYLHRGHGHRPHGGHQSEPRVRSVDRELLEMARLYRFSQLEDPAPCDTALHPALLQLALEIVIGGGWKLAGDGGTVLTTNSGIGGPSPRPAQCAAGRHHAPGHSCWWRAVFSPRSCCACCAAGRGGAVC